jgi:hypothetical protein
MWTIVSRKQEKIQIFLKITLLTILVSFSKELLYSNQTCAWSQTKLQESKIFSSLLKVQNLCSSSGLVKMSASCLSVLTWLKMISALVSWSLKKWCLISICLDLEWFTGLFASLMALSLSHKSGILLNLQPKSLKVNLIQCSYAQQAPAVTYSASAVDRAMDFCFLELQDRSDRPRNWQVSNVLFLSTLQPA